MMKGTDAAENYSEKRRKTASASFCKTALACGIMAASVARCAPKVMHRTENVIETLLSQSSQKSKFLKVGESRNEYGYVVTPVGATNPNGGQSAIMIQIKGKGEEGKFIIHTSFRQGESRDILLLNNTYFRISVGRINNFPIKSECEASISLTKLE